MTNAADDLPELSSPKQAVRVRSFMYERTPDHHHRGIDLPAAEGTRVYAAAGGRVVAAHDAWKQGFTGYGRVVVIAVPDGTYHLYAHLERTAATIGETVPAGSLIGYVGNSVFSKEDHTRESGGAHLHFEVSPTKYPQESEAPRIDPVSYLRAGHIHPLLRTKLGPAAPSDVIDAEFEDHTAPPAPTQTKEPRSAVAPFSSRCPCCGQPLPTQNDGGNGDHNS